MRDDTARFGIFEQIISEERERQTTGLASESNIFRTFQEQTRATTLSGNSLSRETLLSLARNMLESRQTPQDLIEIERFRQLLANDERFWSDIWTTQNRIPSNIIQSIHSLVNQTATTNTDNTDNNIGNTSFNTRFNIAHSGSGTKAQQTAKASLLKLYAHYPHCNMTANINEIHSYLNSLPEDTPEKNTLKQNAIACFLYIQSNTDYYPLSNPQVSFIDSLALVWEGIKNIPEPMHMHIESYKGGLVQNLNSAYLAYPNSTNSISCLPGIFTRFTSTLNYAYPEIPDIFVDTTGSAVAEANDSVLFWVKEALAQKNLSLQENILTTWENSNADNSDPASQFRQEMIHVITTKLMSTYGTLLTEQDRQDIINNIEYLPKPTMEELQAMPENNKLRSQVAAIQIWTNAIITSSNVDPQRQVAINYFCDRMNRLIQTQEIPCSEKYQILQSAFSSIKKLDFLAQNLLGLSSQHKWNQTRQKQIDTMISHIQHAYSACSNIDSLANNSLQTIYSTLETNLATLKDAVLMSHRDTGALRMFGSLQPSSRLGSIITETLDRTNRISP